MNKYYLKFKENPEEIDNYIWDDHKEPELSFLIEGLNLYFKESNSSLNPMEIKRFITLAEERLSLEDSAFYINERSIHPSKFKDKIGSLIKFISDDILDIYANFFFLYAIESRNSIVVKKLFNKTEYKNYKKLNKEDLNFLLETISLNDILEDPYFEDNQDIVEYVDDKNLKVFIKSEEIFYYRDADEFSDINFLKEYLTYHLGKNEVCNEDIILDKIRKYDYSFVENHIHAAKRNLYLLDEKYKKHKSLFDDNKDEISDYYDNNKSKFSIEELFQISCDSDYLLTKIFQDENINSEQKENLYKRHSIEKKVKIFNSTAPYDSLGNIEDKVVELINNNIGLDDIVIKKSMFLKSSDKNIKKIISLKKELLNLKLLSNTEISKDNVRGILESTATQEIFDKVIKSNKLNLSELISLSDRYNLSLLRDANKLFSYEMSTEDLTYLFKKLNLINESVNYAISRSLNDFLNSLTKKDIMNLDRDNLKYLFEENIFSKEDLESLDTEEINYFLFSENILELNNKTILRKLRIDDIDLFVSDINENLRLDLIKPLLSRFSSERAFSKIVEEFYFLEEEIQKEFIREMLKINDSSEIIKNILLEIDRDFKEYSGYIQKLNKEDFLEVVEKTSISVSSIIGRFSEISTKLKISEDSKGISISLPNNEFVISYSTYKNRFKKSKFEFTEEDLNSFKELIKEIDILPKKLKVRIYDDLSCNVLENNEELEFDHTISNIEEIRKWMIFFEKDFLDVEVVRSCREYQIVFDQYKTKKEKVDEFVSSVRKLDLSQVDNLIQDYRNFNTKRPYGIECEFSIQTEDYKYEDEDKWRNLNKEDLLSYIKKEYTRAIDYISEDEDISIILEEFEDYLRDHDYINYETDEEFRYISKNFEKIIEKYDNKKRVMDADKSYRSSDGTTWDMKEDSSVSDEEYGRIGVEIASPKLYGKNDLNIFKKIMKEFIRNNVGTYDDMSVYNAGVHVHHDISDLENSLENSVSDLKRELLPVQEMLFSIVDSSRRDNSYCQKYDFDDIYRRSGDRESINFDTNFGTIEFRMKEGSTDVDDIANWVVLTHEATDKICKNIIKNTQKSLIEKKNIFDKILITAQSAFKRSIIGKSEIEELYDMYSLAKSF